MIKDYIERNVDQGLSKEAGQVSKIKFICDDFSQRSVCSFTNYCSRVLEVRTLWFLAVKMAVSFEFFYSVFFLDSFIFWELFCILFSDSIAFFWVFSCFFVHYQRRQSFTYNI